MPFDKFGGKVRVREEKWKGETLLGRIRVGWTREKGGGGGDGVFPLPPSSTDPTEY